MFQHSLAFVLQARAFGGKKLKVYNKGGKFACGAKTVANLLGFWINEDKIKDVGRLLYHRNRYQAIYNSSIPAFLKELVKREGLDIQVGDEIVLGPGDDPMAVLFSFNCPKAAWAHQEVPGRAPNHDFAIRLWRGRYYVLNEGKTILLRKFVHNTVHPITHMTMLKYIYFWCVSVGSC